MKATSSCSCHSTAHDPCETGVLERPRYFPRQLLTPVDLTLEQQYFRDRMRRHNRLLHGWGVVCGAQVCLVPEDKGAKPADSGTPSAPKPQPWKVRVTSGYILGPYGDEILVDAERVVDLRTVGVEGESGGPHDHGEPADPWCAEVFVKRDPGPLWLAVRYKELLSRPVRVEPAGCGCEDSQCEFSRLRDGYEIGVLAACPPTHENPPDLDELFHGPTPGCPDCPADPWVVLARVEMDTDGTITSIDNCSCRRIVASFAQVWWRCQGDSCAIESIEVENNERVEPGAELTLIVKTRLLTLTSPELSLGDGVDFKSADTSAPNRIKANFFVQPTAEPGPRNLEIRDNQGKLVAARGNAVTVLPKKVDTSQQLSPSPSPAGPGGSSKPQRKGKGGDQ